MVSLLLSVGLWPSPSTHHCCADPRSCTARMLCGANSMPMAGLLMRFGAAVHAGEALRLVACGKAPSWRDEAVVQVGAEGGRARRWYGWGQGGRGGGPWEGLDTGEGPLS